MNMQKILHSYKHWQDYNKQYDIGLMTLYQNQDLKKQEENSNYFHHRTQGRDSQMQDANLHYQVEAELLGEEYKGRYHSLGSQAHSKATNGKDVAFKHKKYRKSKQRKDTPENQERRSIKVGYYDVTHLSNLQSQRTINEFPLLERCTKFRRQSLILPPQKLLPELKVNRQRKFLQEMGLESPKKLKSKTASILKGSNGSPSDIYAKLFKKQSKNPCEAEPINFSDYKLISFCKYKQRERGNDCRATFKNPIQSKNSINPDHNSPTFRLKRLKNDPNQLKLKLHSKTLMSSRVMEEGGLGDAISIYFTPVSVEKMHNPSQSL